MTESAARGGFASSQPTVSLGSALFLTVLIVVALGALAFWPSRPWAPPPRPGLEAPIVFDEFVNAPPSPQTSANGPDPAAR